MERRDTKLSFEIKFVLSNDGCIFPSEMPGHQPDEIIVLFVFVLFEALRPSQQIFQPF